MPSERVPTEIKPHQKSRVMEIQLSDGRDFRLPYEFLRVYSPSAEVPVDSYAVQPVFSDGHSTGIYSWDYLYELGENQEKLWSEYLGRLAAAGASRE